MILNQNPEPRNRHSKERGPSTGLVRYIFIAVGLISLALGTVGVLLPVLPSTPFFLLAAFCFAKGSAKLHDWFISTKLYKKHLESFVKKRAMTVKGKLSVVGSVTVLMSVGFMMMGGVPAGRIILAVVWLLHVIYFFFGVKTIKKSESSDMKK